VVVTPGWRPPQRNTHSAKLRPAAAAAACLLLLLILLLAGSTSGTSSRAPFLQKVPQRWLRQQRMGHCPLQLALRLLVLLLLAILLLILLLLGWLDVFELAYVRGVQLQVELEHLWQGAA
jgi:hypothetical protein